MGLSFFAQVINKFTTLGIFIRIESAKADENISAFLYALLKIWNLYQHKQSLYKQLLALDRTSPIFARSAPRSVTFVPAADVQRNAFS